MERHLCHCDKYDNSTRDMVSHSDASGSILCWFFLFVGWFLVSLTTDSDPEPYFSFLAGLTFILNVFVVRSYLRGFVLEFSSSSIELA